MSHSMDEQTALPTLLEASMTAKAMMRASKYACLLRAVLEWRGLDGDGISDPLRTQIVDGLEAGNGNA
jgi:hypothetical protein